jgi:hypothetical protein
MDKQGQYPNIADILARKAKGRRERAALSFTEKLDVLDKMRRDIEPFVRARRARVAMLRPNKTVA